MPGHRVAILGATGMVGREFIKILRQRAFPVSDLVLLASDRSAGKTVTFGAQEIMVQETTHESFEGVDIVLASAGAEISQEFSPIAAAAGAVVVDNSRAFRMEPDVPLVVPEVNIEDARNHHGIIANPNCSTIQMVVVLKPLHDAARIKRVVVSTYQAVSGTGQKAVEELSSQVLALYNNREVVKKVYPHRIAFNCLPHIDVFLENGYTKEEMKMVNETKKIMGDDSIQVTATTVRVPVFYGHSESVNIETEEKLTPAAAREILSKFPGVKVVDNPGKNEYPMPIDAAGQDLTLVGRIREDFTIKNGLNLWIVADNIRKGAATNAVQIAEILIRDYLR